MAGEEKSKSRDMGERVSIALDPEGALRRLSKIDFDALRER
jgi:hypothetical protein